MAARLLPLSIAEFCAHAQELERVCEERFSDYAARMRAIGENALAQAFERMAGGLRADIAALQGASGERKPAQLTPWEYAWRLTYMPDAVDDGSGIVPSSAREALQCALHARRRAGIFYEDAAENAGDAEVRACAAEMAAAKLASQRRLERMLACEVPAGAGGFPAAAAERAGTQAPAH